MTTTYLERRPSLHERVGVDSSKYPGVWIVKSLGPKNAKLQRENGVRGITLTAPYGMLTAPPEPGVVPVAATVYYSPGEFVRIPNGKYAGLWVVTADPGRDNVMLGKPGGSDQRLSAPRSRPLQRVPVEEVLKEEALKGLPRL